GETACARADLVHVGSGADVFRGSADPGTAVVGCADEVHDARAQRRVLVSAEDQRVYLPVYVGALHAAALPLRPVDAPGLVHSDSAGDRECAGRGHRHDSRIRIWLEPLAGDAADYGDHAGHGDLATVFER